MNSYGFKTPRLWSFVAAAPGHSYGYFLDLLASKFSATPISLFSLRRHHFWMKKDWAPVWKWDCGCHFGLWWTLNPMIRSLQATEGERFREEKPRGDRGRDNEGRGHQPRDSWGPRSWKRQEGPSLEAGDGA